MLDTIERPQTEKITEPAKKWANRFRIVERIREYGASNMLEPGHEFVPSLRWPSKDIAEQKALERMDVREGVTEYLGAFPVES